MEVARDGVGGWGEGSLRLGPERGEGAEAEASVWGAGRGAMRKD